MIKIFVSYHSKDRTVALLVADFLSREGYDTWVDRQLTPGGQYLIDVKHHLEDADLVLVLWTTGATQSAWVNSEAQSGSKRGRLISINVGDGSAPPSFVGTVVGRVDSDLEKRDLQRIAHAVKLAATSALGVERVYRVGEILPNRAWDIVATMTTITVSISLGLFLLFRYSGTATIADGAMYVMNGDRLLPLTLFVIIGFTISIACVMAPFASMGARILDNLGCKLWNLPVTATPSRLLFRWIGESLGSSMPMAFLLWFTNTPTRQAFLEQGFSGTLYFYVVMPLAWAAISGIFLLSPKFIALTIFPSIRRTLIT